MEYSKKDILAILESVIATYDDKFNVESGLAKLGIYTDEVTNGLGNIIDTILHIEKDTEQADAIYEIIDYDKYTARERAEKAYEMRWE